MTPCMFSLAQCYFTHKVTDGDELDHIFRCGHPHMFGVQRMCLKVCYVCFLLFNCDCCCCNFFPVLYIILFANGMDYGFSWPLTTFLSASTILHIQPQAFRPLSFIRISLSLLYFIYIQGVLISDVNICHAFQHDCVTLSEYNFLDL